MKSKHKEIRQSIAREAARLMYEEGVREYYNAKRIAASRLLGKAGGRSLRHRALILPSNGEIQQALLDLAELLEGEDRRSRLFAMRAVALEMMRDLKPFRPRLIGSVSTGHIRKGSDIDLHVFCESIEALEDHLEDLDIAFEKSEVSIRKGNQFRDFTHIHLERVFAVELSVYDPYELRIVQTSSTDGKPIVRVKASMLEDLIAREHPEQWLGYLQTGQIPGLEECENQEGIATLAESESPWMG